MIILLDTGIAGLLAKPDPDRDAHQWLVGLLQRGRTVMLPEIVDYELRRELLRARISASVRALDELPELGCEYLPLTTSAIRRAAAFWADLRMAGQPTAGSRDLDADCILAGQARDLAEGEARRAVVATRNVRHISRMVDAQEWTQLH